MILHYPRLDTVLAVEARIRKTKEYPTRMELWRSLPKQVQYQTFQLILKYLQDSHKIFITKDGKIMWVFAGSKLLEESVAYARGKTLKGVRRGVRGTAGKGAKGKRRGKIPLKAD